MMCRRHFLSFAANNSVIPFPGCVSFVLMLQGWVMLPIPVFGLSLPKATWLYLPCSGEVNSSAASRFDPVSYMTRIWSKTHTAILEFRPVAERGE